MKDFNAILLNQYFFAGLVKVALELFIKEYSEDLKLLLRLCNHLFA